MTTRSLPLSAERMAHLIVDALHDAGLVRPADFPAAVAVAALEIRVRVSMGNVIVADDVSSDDH